MYFVRIRAKGNAPHHFHNFLEEHHLIPERIDGVHQAGNRAARCTQSDIVYLERRKAHSFRNNEDREVSFPFICGSRRTGPWDYVQDIVLRRDLKFPKKISDDVRDIGGRKLQDVVDNLLRGGSKSNVRKRLTPSGMRLVHDVIRISDQYVPLTNASDIQCFVAHGDRRIEVSGTSRTIGKGDVFVIPAGIKSQVLNDNDLILYEFTMR
jgi:hypothetical protein